MQLESPLKFGAKKVVNQLKGKVIRCIMLTGDRNETAAQIGMNCGITNYLDAFLSGREIERMALDEVARQSDYCSVFSRLSPSQKGIIARILQERHHSVAMIGDGPNDGIALKVADIGISFEENSSQIAMRFADVLIQKLSDIPILLKTAARLKWETKIADIFRMIGITAILLSQYGWAFAR